jgi:iron complex outermembrane receptor protein
MLLAAFKLQAEELEVPDQQKLTNLPLEQLMAMDVQSASKIASQISIAPSAVSIVTAEDIKAYGYRTLAEILESMRGLYISNDHSYSYLGGRGYGRPGDFTGRIMLLLDGNQVNNNIYNSAGLDYAGIIDPALIERVEYVSGPGSTIYGNNAFFGIINIVTKRGHDINGVQVSSEVSSHHGREAKIHFGKRLENGAEVLFSASGFNSDGQNFYFPGAVTATSDGVARNLDDQQSRRLFGKVERDGWFAEVAYSTRKKDIPTAPYAADFNAPNHDEESTLEANLRHDRSLSKSLQMSLSGYYGQYDNDRLATYSGLPSSSNASGRWLGVNAQFVGTWFENQRILFGSEFRSDFEQEINTPSLNLDTHEKTFSFYVQDEISMGKKWKANIGTRIDINRNKAGQDHEDTSPRLALIYQPIEATTLKLSWSTAFRRANPYERYFTDDFLSANPALKPERMEASEFVVEHHFDRNTRILGSIYRYETDDYIWSVPVAGKTQFKNRDGGTAHGGDLEFEKHWSNSVRLRASAAIQNAKNGYGLWQINSPRHIGKINLSLPLWQHSWRAAFELQNYGERKTERATVIGGYTLANLTITADHLLPNLAVAFGIRNLFDRDYDAVAPKSNHMGSLNPLAAITQDGRTYWLRATYDFK